MQASEGLPEGLPGNTRLPITTYNEVKTPLKTNSERRIIVLASNEVTDQTLFVNGLTQNIVVLYHLFESLGFEAYLLQHSITDAEKKSFLRGYKNVVCQDLLKMRIHLFIEIGMSIDALTRGYLRGIGCNIAKLYLGNILNIDVETIQNYSTMFFNHHIVGEIDEIWTSPHYLQHVEYAAVLNRVPINKGKVVPYVWDPCFLERYGTRDQMEWQAGDWTTQDMVIVDPNISFQKCSFYSLLLAEAFSKRYPEWRGTVHVVNGDRLKLSSNAQNHLLPAVSLYAAGRVKLYERRKIHDIMRDHRGACFITHQWNNDYNYMTLELMHCGYPILHNSVGWKEHGYYYSLDDWDAAVKTLHVALCSHQKNRFVYQTHAAQLIWKHSIHHPDVQTEWRRILEF
jgi:hypothetical protein